ncbi:hypothetical protein IGB42_00226 [Andreprevotia sp. IGB-42]|nr:hypothetical protein IGB42_00226 [Andreprevotia sp. IGB-42]
MSPIVTPRKALSGGLLDVLIRAGLVAVLVIFCMRIASPFLNLLVWSLILAITLYPLQLRLSRKLGNKDGRAALLIVLVAVGIIIVPTYLLSVAVVDSVENAMTIVKTRGFHIPPPAESIAGWPLIGQRIYDFWLQAATDITGLLQKITPQLKEATRALMGVAAGVGKGMLLFVVALLLAGVFMAYGEAGSRSALPIASRLFGPEKGLRVVALCVATVRAVAQGVIGIAFIQMLLVGVAFVLNGVPAAGLLALGVLLLGIMQLPATLITIPVIIYVLSTQGATAGNIVFAIYVFVAGLADNVLKPLLLGRGVDVPMPVILLGALGGMISGGIIGLFIGPVALAVGYQLFWQWVEDQPPHPAAGTLVQISDTPISDTP